jgi:hypothetical protein
MGCAASWTDQPPEECEAPVDPKPPCDAPRLPDECDDESVEPELETDECDDDPPLDEEDDDERPDEHGSPGD